MTYTLSNLSPPAATGAAPQNHCHSFTLIGAAVAVVTAFATIAVAVPAEARVAVRSGESTCSRPSETTLQQQVACYRYFQTVQQMIRTDLPITSLGTRIVR